MNKKKISEITTASTYSSSIAANGRLGQNRTVHCILGMPIDLISMGDLLTEIDNAVQTRRKVFISTSNLNFITLSLRDDAFRSSLRRSDLCVTDGIGVKLIGMILDIPIPERVAGSDILNAIWDRPESFEKGPLKIFFFGGTEEANQRACDNVNQYDPEKIVCVGNLYPGFGTYQELSSQVIIDKINAAKADFLIVALGAKKGQAWIMHNMDKLNVPVISHLGATINFLAGSVQRAPSFWQRFGLEWLWRVKEEPPLAKRYLLDGLILLSLFFNRLLPIAIWQRWCKWRHDEKTLSVTQIKPEEGQLHLKLKGSLIRNNIQDFKKYVDFKSEKYQNVYLNIEDLDWIDTSGMGHILLLSEKIKNHNGRLNITHGSALLCHMLKLNGLADLLPSHHS